MTEQPFEGELRDREFAGALQLGSVFSAPGCSLLASAAPGQYYLCYHKIHIPVYANLTGLQVINGATANGNWWIALYDYLGQNLLASSGAVAQSGTNVIQRVPFTTPYQAISGSYWAAVLSSSSTGTAQSGQPFELAGTAVQGSAAIPSTITLPTTNATVPLLATY